MKARVEIKCILFVIVLGMLIGPDYPVRASDHDGYAAKRKAMVSGQIVSRGVKDKNVLSAMLSVPRHLFVPERLVDSAYDDSPLPIGHGQTISQPYIVAYMTEILGLDKDSTVLEIGTGSGYQAAVLSPLVKKVYSVEIIPRLAESARERLKALKYDNVEVRTGDGYFGWARYAPYDAIIVTAAAGHIPAPLISQLKKGGRMVIPVGGVFMVQNLVLIRKDRDGGLTTKNLLPVRFVPLTGGKN